MGCFGSKYEMIYEYNLFKSGFFETKCKHRRNKYIKNKHICSKEFKIYCSICKKCVIDNLYYHCYNCNKCKSIFIDYCEMI